MEPATAHANPGAPPPPKLAIDRFADGDLVCLKLAGTIDEAFEGKRLAESVRSSTLILDLGDIRKVSSFGIREWVDFMNGVGKTATRIILVECAPKIVDQLNMVANFAGTGRVYSFYAPYHCDYCDKDERVLWQADRDVEVIKSMKPPQRACGTCGELQYFNEDPVTYFSYLAGQDKLELDPDIAGFLAAKLSYAVADGARKLRVDKTIEGRVTFLKLAGDLDKTFPRDKLAEGLEGTIVVDVAGVGKIEPAGAAEWRGLLQQVTPLVDAIYLTAVPPAFLDKLGRPEDLGPKAAVASFSLPYTCAKCATTAGQMIDVDAHYEVLKFATPPDLRCAACKGPLTCAAPEGLLANLAKLPKPGVSAELAKLIREVRERKPAPKKVATTVAEVAQGGRGGGLGVAFAAALAAVALAGGAFAAYKMFGGKAAASGKGEKTASSAETRPAWITSDAPLAAGCAADGAGLRCVGVSGWGRAPTTPSPRPARPPSTAWPSRWPTRSPTRRGRPRSPGSTARPGPPSWPPPSAIPRAPRPDARWPRPGRASPGPCAAPASPRPPRATGRSSPAAAASSTSASPRSPSTAPPWPSWSPPTAWPPPSRASRWCRASRSWPGAIPR
jgi:anti-anti-sigma regulatory factor